MTYRRLSRRDAFKLGAGASAAASAGMLMSKQSSFAAPAVIQSEITLRMMTHNTLEQPAGEVLMTILDEFQAENPNIKIELDEVPNADILTKLTAYSEADDLPDIIDGQFGLASFINLDAALDVTQYVQDQGLEESFIPVALTAGKDSEGRILGLPFYTGTDALYYRLDHFEEAGLDPNAPPTTWEELAEYATALTDPRAGRYGFGMYGKTHTVRCIHFMQNNGPDGEMMRLEDDGTWTILVNSPESIEAIEFMVSLARDAQAVPPNVVEMDYPANVAAFSGGNISMLTTGPWGAQTFIATNPEIEGKFAVAKHPTPTGETPILRQGSLIYAVGRTSEHPDEAFQLLRWFTHDRQPYFAANAKYGPTTLAALEDPAIAEDPFLKIFLEQSQTAVVEPYEVQLPEWNEMKDQFDPQWQASLLGDVTVTDGMNIAAQRFAEILGDRAVIKYPIE